MDSQRFFRLAVRTFAYDGVMTARAVAEQEEGKTTAPTDSEPPALQRNRLMKSGGEVSAVPISGEDYFTKKLRERSG